MKQRIHLVRHGLSESNVDLSRNQHVPDHLIELDPRGHKQAEEAGRALYDIIDKATKQRQQASPSGFAHQRIQFLVSPYLRTNQTAAGVQKAFKDAGVEFETRECLGVREQNFGLFNGYSDDEINELFPMENKHYRMHVEAAGEFFAGMPMGESHADVCDRVRTVFGGIARNFSGSKEPPVTDVVIVGHGVSNRCFIKEWLHKPWTWMEESRNPNNCSIMTLEGGIDRGWTLNTMFDGFAPPPDSHKSRQQEREEGHIA